MLKRIANGAAFIDPDMIAVITDRDEGGVTIFMKQEGGGAKFNFSEGTAQESYDFIFGDAPVKLDPRPWREWSGARFGEQNPFGDRTFDPEPQYSQNPDDYDA